MAAAAGETLSDALAEAYRTNPDLKAARAALDAQNELRPQALAGWLPSVTVTGNAQRAINTNPVNARFPSGFNGSNRVNDLIIQPGLSQPIANGKQFPQLAQAEHLIRQQRATLLQAEETVLGNAATIYMAVLADEQQLGFQIENRDRLRQTASAIEKLLRIGEVTLADSALAQARLEQAEASVAAAQGQLDEDRAVYKQVIGVPPGALRLPRPLSLPPLNLADARAVARTSNAGVVVSDYALRAARDGVHIAAAALLPSLSAVATWTNDARVTEGGFPGAVPLNGHYRFAFVGLQLTMPLYQGGADYSHVRQAEKTEMQLRFQLDSARNAAVTMVEQAWAIRASAEASVHFNTAQVEAAQLAVNQYQREFQIGLLSVIDLLAIYQQLVGAQIALSQAEQSRIVSDFQVLAALGGLTARTLHLPVAYFDPEGDYHEVKWKIFGLSVARIN
jgi:outer membrane protein